MLYVGTDEHALGDEVSALLARCFNRTIEANAELNREVPVHCTIADAGVEEGDATVNLERSGQEPLSRGTASS